MKEKSLSGKRVQLPNGTKGRVAVLNDDNGWFLARGMEHVQLQPSFPTVVRLDGEDDKTTMALRGSLVVLCEVCDQVSTKVCSKCKNQHYCSRDCQRADWKQHKKVCGK